MAISELIKRTLNFEKGHYRASKRQNMLFELLRPNSCFKIL